MNEVMFEDYIMPELLVIAPVLYALGMAFKSSGSIKDKHIPVFLGIVGIVLALIWCFASFGFSLETVFTAMVQGILVSSAAVYGNQLIVQGRKDE